MSYELILTLSIGFLIITLLIAVVNIAQRPAKSEAMIRAWAAENGYEILDMAEAQFTGRGDFFWSTSRGQTVYKILVVDADGRQRRGRIRCGHWFLGLSNPQTEVRWDE